MARQRQRHRSGRPAAADKALKAEPPFDLDRFEGLALSRHGGDVEQAFLMLHSLLAGMHRSRGMIPAGLITKWPSGGEATPELERLGLLWTRIAHAVSGLFLHPRFETLQWQGFELMLQVKAQLAWVFAASGLETADACIAAFHQGAEDAPFTIADTDLYKVLLLYTLESRFDLPLIIAFDAVDRRAVLHAAVSLGATQFCGTERSYMRRKQLLKYLCLQLQEHEVSEKVLEPLSLATYMLCSYDDGIDKHAIKGLIHRHWRNLLGRINVGDLPRHAAIAASDTRKPVLLILHEWLRTGSAMNRCYADWISALRQRFRTVGMGLKVSTQMDAEAIALFDEYVALPEGATCLEQVQTIHRWCCQHQPAVVYYPSIGMGGHTVAAASLRLAPLQVMTQGHPASTGGSCIDALIASADYIGIDGVSLLDPESLSERLVIVPPHSMSWQKPADSTAAASSPYLPHAERHFQEGYTTQVVVSASPMKLGYPFLKMIAAINQKLSKPVHWHFFIADSHGALHLQIRNTLRGLLGEHCSVYPSLSYPDYVRALKVGDVFLTPFPFGNSNTFYDYHSAGLIGVCLKSRELANVVDACLFHRLGFPEELIADSIDDYMRIAVRLVEDWSWRKQLLDRTYHSPDRRILDFDSGDPSMFADCVYELYQESKGTA